MTRYTDDVDTRTAERSTSPTESSVAYCSRPTRNTFGGSSDRAEPGTFTLHVLGLPEIFLEQIDHAKDLPGDEEQADAIDLLIAAAVPFQYWTTFTEQWDKRIKQFAMGPSTSLDAAIAELNAPFSVTTPDVSHEGESLPFGSSVIDLVAYLTQSSHQRDGICGTMKYIHEETMPREPATAEMYATSPLAQLHRTITAHGWQSLDAVDKDACLGLIQWYQSRLEGDGARATDVYQSIPDALRTLIKSTLEGVLSVSDVAESLKKLEGIQAGQAEAARIELERCTKKTTGSWFSWK